MTKANASGTLIVVCFGLLMFVAYSKATNDANNAALALRAKANSSCEGVITEVHVWDHNRSIFKYTVDGKTYIETRSLKIVEPSVGQHLTVHYDPKSPAENYTDQDYFPSPERSLASALVVNLWPGFFTLFCVLAALGLVQAVRWRNRRRGAR